MLVLLKMIKKLFFPRRRQEKTPVQDSPSQKAAYTYALATFLFLGLQGILATAGSLHLIFPDLPAPLNFASGRAMHLNLSIFWPLLGTMGGVYYFLVEATDRELFSIRLARWGFWYLLGTGMATLGFLAFGKTDGREYLEAPYFLKIALLTGLLAFTFNLLATAIKNRLLVQPEVVVILSGALLAPLLYLPTIFFVTHPTVDDVLRFLVIHLWEEGSLELLATTIGAALLASLKVAGRQKVKRLLLWEAGLVLTSGFIATGHHYYWIGTPDFWKVIGSVASGLQVVPVVLLALTAWQTTANRPRNFTPNLALYFFYASVFWNVVGAGLLGFLLAIPPLNRYAHGTYFTSAHAHMALFGFFGFLVLASSYYILTRRRRLSPTHVKRIKLSLVLLNSGLALMAACLVIAGFLQTYLWRGLGMDFTQVHLLLLPYLLLRTGGGAIFAAGGFLLAWEMVSLMLKPWMALLKPGKEP